MNKKLNLYHLDEKTPKYLRADSYTNTQQIPTKICTPTGEGFQCMFLQFEEVLFVRTGGNPLQSLCNRNLL